MFGMFGKIRNEIAENHKQQILLQEHDNQLVTVLFELPTKTGELDKNDILHVDASNFDSIQNFLHNLELIHQIYEDKNPALAGALWGIYNAADNIYRRQSISKILLSNEKKRTAELLNLKGMVATAIIQYSSGKFKDINTRYLWRTPDKYSTIVEKAKSELKEIL